MIKKVQRFFKQMFCKHTYGFYRFVNLDVDKGKDKYGVNLRVCSKCFKVDSW